MSYSPAYMQPSLMEGQESTQLYSSAMQLTSYANNIMGHTMNQYAAQTSLLSSQVGVCKAREILRLTVTSFRFLRSTTTFLKLTSPPGTPLPPLLPR